MTFETKTTSLVVDQPLTAAPWYWRVSALKGETMQSLPSDTANFTVLALPSPTLTSPPDDANFELQDVVMDWDPVPGAKSYDLQVSTSQDFTVGTSLIETRTGIVGTRYSPIESYDNNQYYWRVRAVDLDNRATAWSPARSSFNRTWPNIPQLVYPAGPGNETAGTPMYFQWESVQHASEYELQLGTQVNFTTGTYESCRVAGTTYVPGQFAINTTGVPSTNRANEDCEPQVGQINYWRVRAARPTVPEVRGHPRRPGHLLRDPGLHLPAGELQQPVAGQRPERLHPDLVLDPRDRRRGVRRRGGKRLRRHPRQRHDALPVVDAPRRHAARPCRQPSTRGESRRRRPRARTR